MDYSARCRQTFGEVDPARTARELAFLTRVLPLPEFGCVLDVPCGNGRHMHGMAAAGYRMRGVDLDARSVAQAGPGAETGDMRSLDGLAGTFDAVINMWASFGFFDASTNRRVLEQFGRRLRTRGRLVLDVYDPAFFESRQGTRENRGVRDTKIVRESRLHTVLDYGDGDRDLLEWQLYTPEELIAESAACGLRSLLECADFDEAIPPRGEHPRMQLVLERADQAGSRSSYSDATAETRSWRSGS